MNKVMNVELGQVLKLTLKENPTTGYEWIMAVSSGLKIISDKYIPSSNSNGIVGAGGVHEWKIKAIDEGQQLISGIYKRPWEDINPNDQRYMRLLIVQRFYEE